MAAVLVVGGKISIDSRKNCFAKSCGGFNLSSGVIKIFIKILIFFYENVLVSLHVEILLFQLFASWFRNIANDAADGSPGNLRKFNLKTFNCTAAKKMFLSPTMHDKKL